MSIFGTNIKLFFENVRKNIKEIEDLAWEKKEYMEFIQKLAYFIHKYYFHLELLKEKNIFAI